MGSPSDTLASRALGLIASNRAGRPSLLSERLVDDLRRSVRSGDGSGRSDVVRDMLGAGLRREDIADFYIPEVARRLGAEWSEDTVSFAEVTIGVARLQGLLRTIGSDWFSDADLDPEAPCVLVVVPPDEFHTLGPTLFSAQLCRLGISVKLVMGRNEAQVVDVVGKGQFDAVFVSASQATQLATVGRLVKKIRAAAAQAVPIGLGGSVVTRVSDARAKTGADHAATDTRDALRACGLAAPGARRRAVAE